MVRFGFHVLQFHPNRKITENPPTIAANILRKKILVHPLGLRGNNLYCGNKMGHPEWAVSLHLARSGSQSQHGIYFTLQTCGACRMIIIPYIASGKVSF